MTKSFVKRWLTVIVFVAVLFAVAILVMKKGRLYEDVSVGRYIHLKNFKWLDVENQTMLTKCRNSVQGRSLIADEKGYLCSHMDVGLNGCCIPDRNSSKRFSCSTCQQNRCCKVYEHCVSCCLQPNKHHILQNVLERERNSLSPLLRVVSDTFELCLSKCRTSSLSVQQENVYRDSMYKYCYGLDLPNLQPIT